MSWSCGNEDKFKALEWHFLSYQGLRTVPKEGGTCMRVFLTQVQPLSPPLGDEAVGCWSHHVWYV